MTIYTIFGICAVAGLLLTILFGVILKRKPDNWLLMFLQQFVGSLLIFSGYVKAVDPWGTVYKMEQYFAEFESAVVAPINGIFPFLAKMGLTFSIATIVLELLLGICLILGIKRKFTAWALLPMLIFFTLLTGFTYLTSYSIESLAFMTILISVILLGGSALFARERKTNIGLAVGALASIFIINLLMKSDYQWWFSFSDWSYDKNKMKVTDCGCFGDFLKLEPKVSFIKDLILLPISIWFVASWGKLTEIVEKRSIASGAFWLAIVGFTLFCLKNSIWGLPQNDFRPFAEGINLPKAKEDAINDPDIIDRYLTYKNTETGEEVEIKADALMDNQHLWKKPTPWEGVKEKTREIVVKKGSTSKIKDFEFSDPNSEGEDISDRVVGHEGYQFMIVSYSMEKANRKYYKQVSAVAQAAEKDGYRTFGVTQIADPSDVDKFRHDIQATYPFFTADDILLKTIIRSNPGILLLKDGTVVKKWHGRNFPDYANIKAEYIK